MKSRQAARLWAATMALFCAVGAARSEPFEKERCDSLVEEHGKLAALGVAEVVRKGPQWAADNVPAERVAEARRFLALEEALLFRCGHAKLRAAPPPVPVAEAAAAGPGAGTAAAAAVAGAGVAAAAKAKTGARKAGKASNAVKPGAAKAARVKSGKGEPGEAAASPKPKTAPKPNPKAKEKAKAKAKADDAFRPPAKTSGVTN